MLEEEEYPLHGVRLSALKRFVGESAEGGGLDATTLSTAEFCAKIVVEKTTRESKSALVHHFDPIDVRPVASIFVSHAVRLLKS